MVFLLLLGIYGGCCVGEEEIEEVDVVFGSQDDDDVSCSRYCDGTYPEHTYPDVRFSSSGWPRFSRLSLSLSISLFLSLRTTLPAPGAVAWRPWTPS